MIDRSQLMRGIQTPFCESVTNEVVRFKIRCFFNQLLIAFTGFPVATGKVVTNGTDEYPSVEEFALHRLPLKFSSADVTPDVSSVVVDCLTIQVSEVFAD